MLNGTFTHEYTHASTYFPYFFITPCAFCHKYISTLPPIFVGPPPCKITCYRKGEIEDFINSKSEVNEEFWNTLLAFEGENYTQKKMEKKEKKKRDKKAGGMYMHAYTLRIQYVRMSNGTLHGTFIHITVRSHTGPRAMSASSFKGKEGQIFGIKPQQPPSEYKGRYDPIAEDCGLLDKFQVNAVMEYLFLNGQNALKYVSYIFFVHKMFILSMYDLFQETVVYLLGINLCFFQIPKDGNCMYRAIWEQMGFQDDKDAKGPNQSEHGTVYTPDMLRRQLVFYLASMMDVSTNICREWYIHICVGTFTGSLVHSYGMFILQSGYADLETQIINEIYGQYGVLLSDEEEEAGDTFQPGPFTLKNYCM